MDERQFTLENHVVCKGTLSCHRAERWSTLSQILFSTYLVQATTMLKYINSAFTFDVPQYLTEHALNSGQKQLQEVAFESLDLSKYNITGSPPSRLFCLYTTCTTYMHLHVGLYCRQAQPVMPTRGDISDQSVRRKHAQNEQALIGVTASMHRCEPSHIVLNQWSETFAGTASALIGHYYR